MPTNPHITSQRALNALRELIAQLVPAAQSREPSAQYIVRTLRAVDADMVAASAAWQALTVYVSCEFCGGTGNNPWPLMGPRDCPECKGAGRTQGRIGEDTKRLQADNKVLRTALDNAREWIADLDIEPNYDGTPLYILQVIDGALDR